MKHILERDFICPLPIELGILDLNHLLEEGGGSFHKLPRASFRTLDIY